MTDATSSWAGFHATALARPPRELLRRTLGCFQVEGRPPGLTVDLGCGSGPDSLELLRRGWQVHAVDADGDGLQLLRQAVPPEVAKRLHLHAMPFHDFVFPPCDLVWASWSLPFCDPSRWHSLWQSATAALRPGGRIAGDLFGTRHAFAEGGEVLVLDESAARGLFAGLELEAFDVEDGVRPSGGAIVRWHAFGFAARKPGPRNASAAGARG